MARNAPTPFLISTPNRTNPSQVSYGDLDRATRDLDGPLGVLSLPALAHNAQDLVRRAGGKPVRVATKSVRCRDILRWTLACPGFRGLMAYTVAEAVWLSEEFEDVLVAYPSADRAALKALAESPTARQRVTLMIDSVAQLDFLSSFASSAAPLRLCLDLDASLQLAGGLVHLGMRRSPVHDADQAAALAAAVQARSEFVLVGVMSYEGQVAGLGDAAGSVSHRAQMRLVRSASIRELAPRRAEAIAAIRATLSRDTLEFVNGGGTGSIETTAAEDAITEVAAGSGLFAPTLFDGYRDFRPQPAAFFALTVVRIPAPGYATCLGGGWIASGPAGKDRLPTPVWPAGLSLLALEGAGEVQTPVHGDAAKSLKPGDKVWFRHTKAGELSEHVNELLLVDGSGIVDSVLTYRGEGKAWL